MRDAVELIERWQMDLSQVRRRMYRAPTARERERWHALWLLARGWAAAEVAQALERDAHTIGNWLDAFREAGPDGLIFEQTGGSPRPWPGRASRAEGSDPDSTTRSRDRRSQVDLESSARVRPSTLGPSALSDELPQLPASSGFRAEEA